MKKTLLTLALLAGVSSTVFGQGAVYIDLAGNNPAASSTATTDGVIFVKTGAAAAVLNNTDVSYTLLAGTSSSSLTPIFTGSGSFAFGDNDGSGQFTDNSGLPYSLAAGSVPANSTAFLELEVWAGTTISSFANVGSDPSGSAIWSQAVGQVGSTSPAPGLTGMPSIVMTVPEPSTIVLGGLGAALLLFRRKK